MTACQNGEIFKSRYFETKGSKDSKPQIELRLEVKIGVAWHRNKRGNCWQHRQNSFVVKKDDKMKISLTWLTVNGSKIYLCDKNLQLLLQFFLILMQLILILITPIGMMLQINNKLGLIKWNISALLICLMLILIP